MSGVSTTETPDTAHQPTYTSPHTMEHTHIMTDTGTSNTDPGWRDRAACLDSDPELWFSDHPFDQAVAQRICGTCDVRDTCLEGALRRGEPAGIWGGLNDRQRRRSLKGTTIRAAQHLGTCHDCHRDRYSTAKKDRHLPEGGVWNADNTLRARAICQDCAEARDRQETVA